jgi:hypothetical protein
MRDRSIKNLIVPMLFALTGVGFLIKAVKQFVTGEPLNLTFVVLPCVFFCTAIIFVIKSRAAQSPYRQAEVQKQTLFEGSLKAAVRSIGLRFRFPRGVGALDFDLLA